MTEDMLFRNLEEAISRADLETIFSIWSSSRGTREFYKVKDLTDENLALLARNNGIDVTPESFRQLMELYDDKRKITDLVHSIIITKNTPETKAVFRLLKEILTEDTTRYLARYILNIVLQFSTIIILEARHHLSELVAKLGQLLYLCFSFFGS